MVYVARTRHCLTEIDEGARTAVCSICGPTKIKRRAPKTPGGAAWYRCNEAFKADPAERRYRQRRLAHRRGLTPEEVQRLKITQKHRCAICRRKLPLCIDHDHRTGRVRGLLCQPCNQALGLLEDRPQRLRAALEYLR